MKEALANKYRPKRFDDVVGQSIIAKVLARQVQTGNIGHCYLFAGPSGCVSADTEFLTPKGWKRIDEFENGDLVMQYNKETGFGEFVSPIEYIKLPCETLHHIHNKYGVDMTVSDEHRIVYKTYHEKDGKPAGFDWGETTCAEYLSKSSESPNRVHRIVTTFKVDREGIGLSDADIKVMCAVICDGSFTRNTNRCYLNLKKVKKVRMLKHLLEEAGIEYDVTAKLNGYTLIKFYAPLRKKEFDEYWYGCSQDQLKVICDNILYWDGCGYDGKLRFSQKNKKTIDFLQYAFAACGYRSTIMTSLRKARVCRHVNVMGKVIEYSYGDSLEYTLMVSNKWPSELTFKDRPDSHFKLCVEDVRTVDGFKYCFRVPSTMWVMRHNDRICVTGNCGKTTLARIFANEINGGHGSPIEIDAASNNGVDNVRSIIEQASQRSLDSEYKCYIIDECHSLTTQAWQAFLKCIEEPPEHTVFMFCTTNPDKVPQTIQNRVQRFSLNRIRKSDIANRLKLICSSEGAEEGFEESCEYIAGVSDGHLRDAITNLDKCLSCSSKLPLKGVIKMLGGFSFETFFEATERILRKDRSVICLIDSMYDSGADLKAFVDGWLSFTLDLVKFCITKSLEFTDIPESFRERAEGITGVSSGDHSPYFSKFADRLLEVKSNIRYESCQKSVIEAALLRMCN